MGNSDLVRFGSFELDRASGELRKAGARVRLQEQPFQVLRALVERPGEVVTREELRERLWPGDTFVEFDDGLNTAVRKIRQALGDSADNPRFVETLPKRGYRFIAPVAGHSPPPPIAADARGAGSPTSKPNHPLRLVAAAAMAIAAVLALGVKLEWFASDEPTPAAPLRVIPLTSYPGTEWTPSLSPDGGRVAFSWNGKSRDNFDIYVRQIDSQTPPERLTTHPGYDTSPAWSPDGRFIAFARTSGDPSLPLLFGHHPIDCEIFVIPAIGGPANKVAETSYPKVAWLPSGKELIGTARKTAGEPSGLIAFSIDGTGKRQISRPPSTPGSDTEPAVSPDGRSMAFLRWVERPELYTIDLQDDLTPIQRAVRQEMDGLVWNLTWLREGRDLILAMGPAAVSGRSLFRWSPSEPLRRVPVPATGATGPDISANGNRLVFTQHNRDQDMALLQRNTEDGSWKTVPFASTTRSEGSPHYSPDGRQIVFNSERASDNLDLWISNADGSKAKLLIDWETATAGSARWSPEGRRIAFDSWGGPGRADILAIRAAGGEPLHLTQDPLITDVMPAWSADGEWVYFASDRSGSWNIWRVSAAGGVPDQVTRNGGTLAMASPDGKYLYYLKDETSPSLHHSELWRMPIGGAEEKLMLRRVFARNFSVTNVGVYFMEGPKEDRSEPGAESPDGFTFRYLDLATDEVRTLAALPHEIEPFYGFAVSPDEQTILFGRQDAAGADLMLVDNFR